MSISMAKWQKQRAAAAIATTTTVTEEYSDPLMELYSKALTFSNSFDLIESFKRVQDINYAESVIRDDTSYKRCWNDPKINTLVDKLLNIMYGLVPLTTNNGGHIWQLVMSAAQNKVLGVLCHGYMANEIVEVTKLMNSIDESTLYNFFD